MSTYDLVIRGGTVFDGSGAPPVSADVGVRGDKVAAIGAGLPEGLRTIDARGRWVIPGMLDVHTHYDAEVLASPGLGESVRHGVTTVIVGNCSLSTVYCDADDCADMFARVEALPRRVVASTVNESKTWHDPASYVAAISKRCRWAPTSPRSSVTPTCGRRRWAWAARSTRRPGRPGPNLTG
jgi:N-acyl-D-aspartate/D-glutamate deacylase